MSLGGTVLVVSWTEFGVVTLLFVARTYVNACIVKQFNADYWVASLTYTLAVIAQAFLVLSVHWGLGQSLSALTGPQIAKNQLYQWVFSSFAIASIAFGKIAIIVFILQFEPAWLQNRRTWVLYVLGGLTILASIAIIPIIWTQCTPTTKIWNDTIPGSCNGRVVNEKFAYFLGSFSAFCDVALAAYPIVVFWNLQMRFYIKVGLSALFGCGVIAAVCASVKTKQLGTLTATSDLTYQLAPLDIWAGTEMWTIIMVSCIPPIRPLFVRAFKGIQSTSGASKANNNKAPSYLYSGPYASQSNNIKRSQPKVDNESEENILQEDGIMLTRKVSIHYEESGRSMNSKYTSDMV